MLFNSIQYAIFLPIVFILYWALPHKYRCSLLLVASYYFYMSWNVKYVALILLTTTLSYLAGLLLGKTEDIRKRKLILGITLAICLGVLVIFKYLDFLFATINKLASLFTIHLNPITLNLILPVGISFYTFQTLSYVIDVYKGDVKAEKNFGYYATFISFFPQLVAGPIERTRNLLPQIKEEHKFSYEKATYGLKLMAWGFFKKLAIADVIASYVDLAFGTPTKYDGFAFVVAMFLFSIQIYCDFSGYSDIAIGTAKLMGIDLMTNFKSPYFSMSVREFWSRWHISLSTWFRDYVYIPLGGNRVSSLRHKVNLMIVFLVSGLWHGANWTFVVWGGIHGFAQVLESSFRKRKSESQKFKWIKIIPMFIFLTLAWAFFRAQSFSDVHYIFTHLFNGISRPRSYLHDGFTTLGIGKRILVEIAFPILVLSVYDFFSLKSDPIEWIGKQKPILRWCMYIALIFITIFLMPVKSNTKFIYFQF